MFGIRVFLPALAAVVCAGVSPPAPGQNPRPIELLPLPGGSATAPASVPGVPPRPDGYAVGIYRVARVGQGEGGPSAEVAEIAELAELAEIDEALRAIAETAPNVKSAVFLAAPKVPCAPMVDDDAGLAGLACLSLLGASQEVDLVALAVLAPAEGGRSLRVRVIDVASRKQLSQARQTVLSIDRAELKARAEALGCALLIPGGCRGTALVDLDLPEMQLIVDGVPQPRGDEGETQVRLALPVGPHRVHLAAGQSASPERTLLVLRQPDSSISLYGRQLEPGGLTLLAREDLPLALDGSVAVPRSPQNTAARARWIRPAAVAAAGLGALALGLGGYEWQRGRSLASDASAAYDRNGGYYRPGDLGTVSASRSATAAGKVAGLAGLGLLAASAVLVFAF
jgi:hypothetical protein